MSQPRVGKPDSRVLDTRLGLSCGLYGSELRDLRTHCCRHDGRAVRGGGYAKLDLYPMAGPSHAEFGVPLMRPPQRSREDDLRRGDLHGRFAVRGHERLRCRPDFVLNISQASAVMLAEVIDQHGVE